MSLWVGEMYFGGGNGNRKDHVRVDVMEGESQETSIIVGHLEVNVKT